MKRFSLLGLGLLVVLVAAAATATSALAVQPSNLPNTLPKTFSGESEGTTVFHSSVGDIECKTASALESSETSNEPPLGPFHIDFKECKNKETGLTCTGAADTGTPGLILVLGTWHLVFDKEKGVAFKELTTATLFLVNELTFTCSALVSIRVLGEVVCLDLKPTESNVKHSFHCTGSTTEPNDEWCKGGDVAGACSEPTLPKLLQSVNGAAFKVAVELALGNTTYLVAVTGMI